MTSRQRSAATGLGAGLVLVASCALMPSATFAAPAAGALPATPPSICQAPGASASPEKLTLGETATIAGECFGQDKSGTVTIIPPEGSGATTLDITSDQAQSISATYTPDAAGEYKFLIDVENTQASGTFSVAEPASGPEPTEEPTEQPTEEPTAGPTEEPTDKSTDDTSEKPEPTQKPSPSNTPKPSEPATQKPSPEPSNQAPSEPDTPKKTSPPADRPVGNDGEKDSDGEKSSDQKPGSAGTLGPDESTPSPVAPSTPSDKSTPSDESTSPDEPAPSAGGASTSEPTDAPASQAPDPDGSSSPSSTSQERLIDQVLRIGAVLSGKHSGVTDGGGTGNDGSSAEGSASPGSSDDANGSGISEASDGSDSGLAETGSNVSTPAALAALALGLGGIALWIAGRRRSRR